METRGLSGSFPFTLYLILLRQDLWLNLKLAIVMLLDASQRSLVVNSMYLGSPVDTFNNPLYLKGVGGLGKLGMFVILRKIRYVCGHNLCFSSPVDLVSTGHQILILLEWELLLIKSSKSRFHPKCPLVVWGTEKLLVKLRKFIPKSR